jgi:hypothetical protein
LIVGFEEDRFAAIAALGQVVGEAWNDDAGEARHDEGSDDNKSSEDGAFGRQVKRWGNMYRVPVFHPYFTVFQLSEKEQVSFRPPLSRCQLSSGRCRVKTFRICWADKPARVPNSMRNSPASEDKPVVVTNADHTSLQALARREFD